MLRVPVLLALLLSALAARLAEAQVPDSTRADSVAVPEGTPLPSDSVGLFRDTAPLDSVVVPVRRPSQELGAWRDDFALGINPPFRFRLRPGVIPGSEQLLVGGVPLDRAQYALDVATGEGELLLQSTPPPGARLVVIYRTLPWAFRDLYARVPMERARPDSADAAVVGQRARRPEPSGDPLLTGPSRLQRRGSITRGVIAGSNRDVSLESGLRLELSGEVADNVEVQAVLTDENTPIQPEGTTQRLSEFDRVFIQLTTPRGDARLGDVDLTLQGGTFARLNRRLQGGAVRARLPAQAFGATFLGAGSVTVAGATTRGLFQSQDIAPVEGVQGPYRLQGQNGEAFIIVIAGTERVFLDGVALTRGEAGDYTIDYATGELTFTPRVLITAERRITVDFEYTTSRFTRTLLASEATLALAPDAGGRARGTVAVTLLREADSASFGEELGLSQADLDLIAAAGDEPAVRSGAERVPFDAESPFVLYTTRDSTVIDPATGTPVTIPVYVPAGPQDADVFRVRFSTVPAGTRNPEVGTYRRSGRAVNGILYEFVGLSGGEYVPLRVLPKPERRSLVDVRGTFSPLAQVEVFGEWAGSVADDNALSDLGAGDDAGAAFRAGVRLTPLDLGAGVLTGSLERRVRGATFESFERVRAVDFNRTWNVARFGSAFGTAVDTLREDTWEGALRWNPSERSFLEVEAGRLGLSDGPALFSATRYALGGQLVEPGALGGRVPEVEARVDYADSEDDLTGQDGSFLRARAVARQRVLQGRLVPFLALETERRRQSGVGGDLVGVDSLLTGSYAFSAVRPGIGWTTPALDASASVEWRRERDLLDGALEPSATATTFTGELRYRPSSSLQTEARAAWRSKTFSPAFSQLGRPDGESVALRWTLRATPLDRFADLNTVYSATTERTPRLQETYILVGPELGEYVWNDANGDGVQQIDEFVPESTPLEGEYVRALVPGDELVPTANVQALLRLRLDPTRLLGRREGLVGILAGAQLNTTLDLAERTTSDDLLGVYLLAPGSLQRRDSVQTGAGLAPPPTLAGRFRIAQEVAFFRDVPSRDLRLTASRLVSTSQLAAGLEVRRITTLRAEGRLQVAPTLGLRLTAAGERNGSASTTFASRTFQIESLSAEPEVVWQTTPALALTGRLAFALKRNEGAGDPVQATVFRVPVEARYALAGRLSVAARVERAQVSLSEGAVLTGLASYELTEGRGPGVSYLWGVTANYTINAFLRASLTYDGRAPSGVPVIQTLRTTLSAVF